MKTTIRFIVTIILPVFIATCSSKDKSVYRDYPIKPVEIGNVRLDDAFWLPMIKTVQETTISFGLNKCSEEGRMDNFLIAGGKKEGPVCGKMPFDDTDLYKIIEGASYSLISNPDEELDSYLDSLIAIIQTGQEPDGYLTTWFTIDPLNPPADWVRPTNRRWFNSGGHELYNSGHLFEAASAHYHATGKTNFLDIAIRNADLLVNSFGEDTLKIPPGHQIVETGLIKLYNITGNTEYLELSKFFLDQRGNPQSHELEGEYSQDHLPVTQQDEAVGHAVRAVYMYAGMTDIAAIYSDTSYLNAVNKIWNNVVGKKMYLTGGIGSRHRGESFGDNYELPNLTAYNETCASIGDVYWNHRLFMMTGDVKYYDVIERTLYNGLISGISLDGKKFFYPNPLEADGIYEFNQGACTRQAWFDCSCCPTNLIRFIPSIPRLIYAAEKDNLYINLFISNNAETEINGTATKISQETDYPWDGNITIRIDPEKSTHFTICIRVPGWFYNNPLPLDLYSYLDKSNQMVTLAVNGEAIEADIRQGYVEITRTWEKDDRIELSLPMSVQRVTANDKVTEDEGLVAIEYGPLVYCAEEVDNRRTFSQLTIPPGMQFTVRKRDDLLNSVNVITGVMPSGKGQDGIPDASSVGEITMIPYYAWSNRGIGKMKVWLPVGEDAE